MIGEKLIEINSEISNLVKSDLSLTPEYEDIRKKLFVIEKKINEHQFLLQRIQKITDLNNSDKNCHDFYKQGLNQAIRGPQCQ